MRKTLLIAQREYLATVRSKGFLIGLVLAPVLMCGSLIVIKLTEGRVDTVDKKIALIDRSGVVAATVVEAAKTRNAREVQDAKTGKKTKPAYLIEVVPPNDRDPNAQKLELSNRVRRRQLHAFLVVGREVLHPSRHQEAARLEYHAQGSALDDVRRWIGQPVNDRLRELRLAEMGLEQAKVKDLFNWLPVEGMDLVSADAQTGQIKKAEKTNEARAIGVPMVTMILLFLLVMMGATPLLQAVMEEKNQRIAEVLLGCLPPFQLMLGKLAGGLAVSLTGSAVYVSAALLLLGYLGAADWIPYQLLPWFFVFMFGAVVMTGALFAATGSLCNDPKQAQTWTLPALLPLMIPMFSLVPILQAPRSTFATVFSLIPPFTPLVMLLRQSTAAGVPAWQPWVGLAGMLLFTTLVVWVSGRIFRLGLLLQGKPPRVTEVLRWALRG